MKQKTRPNYTSIFSNFHISSAASLPQDSFTGASFNYSMSMKFQGRRYTSLFPPLHHHQLHHHLIYQMKFCVFFIVQQHFFCSTLILYWTSTHFLNVHFEFRVFFDHSTLFFSVIHLVLVQPKLIILLS